MIQGVIFIQSQNSKKWMVTDLTLIAEIRKDGSAGNLYLISTRTEQNVDNLETSERPYDINDEEWEDLQSFHHKLPFTVGKVEKGFDLLKKNGNVSKRNEELSITIISTSSLMIVETGRLKINEPELPIALYPKDE